MRHLAPPLFVAATLVASAASSQPLYHYLEDDSPQVAVDLDLLGSDPAVLALPLPDGETLWAVRSRSEQHADGSMTWSGHETGSAYNSVLLSVRDGRMIGTFSHGSEEWAIIGSTLRRINRGTVPPDFLCSAPLAPPPVTADPPMPPADSPRRVAAASTSTSPVVQDILVLYTEEARQYVEVKSRSWLPAVYAGYTISDLIHYANQVTNEVYANGEIPATTNIVGIERMPDCDTCPDPGVGFTWGDATLDKQQESADIKRLRAQYNADIVYAYIYDTTRPCGITWTRLQGSTARSFFEYAHGYTNLYCDSPSWYPKSSGKRWQIPYYETMAHEIGHMHGALHDRASNNLDESEALFPYAFGHINTASGKKTVMANHSSAKHVNYYSTVRVTPNGWTIGETNLAENERVVKATAASNSELSVYVVPPAKPTIRSVEDSYQSGAVIVYWNDNADNETHYEIRYRRAGQQWEEADVWNAAHDRKANQTKAFIDGLAAGKRYTFRVYAVNDYGKAGSARAYHRLR